MPAPIQGGSAAGTTWGPPPVVIGGLDANGKIRTLRTGADGRIGATSLPLTIGVSGSLGITTAATWDTWATYAVPANYIFVPELARVAVTTAASRTLIVAGRRLGTFNPNTNVYTADGSVTTPDFYDRLFYRIVTTHSATATTVTATYNDQDAASSTATATVIVASAAAGDLYELPLAAGDFGVQSVTNITDTAAPTSVTDEVWGFRTLIETLGPANSLESHYFGGTMGITSAETIFVLLNAAAGTAQQRLAQLQGDLIAA